MVIRDFLSPRPAPQPGDFVSQAECKYGAPAVKPCTPATRVTRRPPMRAGRRAAAGRTPTIGPMNAIEWCERCLSEAPGPASPEYAEWLVLSTPDGEYLGIVCAGCIAEPELLALELEDELLGAAA
jgi:hypothetical protein